MTVNPASPVTHPVPARRQPVPSPGTRSRGPDHAADRDRSLLAVGVAAAVLGVVVEIAMGLLHPSHAAPNDSAAAFEEYSHSEAWTFVHIGQFAGTLLVVVTLVAIARSLSRQPGIAGALAVVGAVTAVLVAAVFAVQMAVDGVALKGTIDTWAHTSAGPDKTAAFLAADSVRWIEKALSSFFHLLNGSALLVLGLSVAFGRATRRWLGWVGAVAGAGFLAGGVVASRTGFSPESGHFLTPALLLSAVFVIGTSVSLWRAARTPR
jgi:fructose-specific phosphotransferase system IIC component